MAYEPIIIDRCLNLFSQYRQSIGARVQLLLNETFRIYNYSPIQSFVEKLTAEGNSTTPPTDPFDSAIEGTFINVSVAPFVAKVIFSDDNSRYGYIRIVDFQMVDTDLTTFKSLLAKMNQMKVKGLILDLLNNGGGSLVHGLAIANTLTPNALTLPSMQIALNDNWINGFRADSVNAPTDAQRTMASRILTKLKEDVSQQKRISRIISTSELSPFILNADKQNCVADNVCLKPEIKVVLLVNEMCASMCDIFAGVFRDNKLGTIIGSQTMGAGGNVVMHGFSPVTQIALTQTESLIVDSNGQYLENQGVVPNEIIDTVYDRLNNYQATYKKALSLIK